MILESTSYHTELHNCNLELLVLLFAFVLFATLKIVIIVGPIYGLQPVFFLREDNRAH